MTAPLIIVAGQARCGTSLCMQMLDAGGIPITGKVPSYECPEVQVGKPVDMRWLRGQTGKAVKILDPHRQRGLLLHGLPLVSIFLQRDFTQQARSHAKFLRAMGVPCDRNSWRRVRVSLQKDHAAALHSAGRLFGPQLVLRFEDLLQRPMDQARTLALFLERSGLQLDVEAAAGMVVARSPKCAPGLMELEQLRAAGNAG